MRGIGRSASAGGAAQRDRAGGRAVHHRRCDHWDLCQNEIPASQDFAPENEAATKLSWEGANLEKEKRPLGENHVKTTVILSEIKGKILDRQDKGPI